MKCEWGGTCRNDAIERHVAGQRAVAPLGIADGAEAASDAGD